MAKGFVACPVCGSEVRKENLTRHRRRVHGEAASQKPAAETRKRRTARPLPILPIVLGVVVVTAGAGAYLLLTQPPSGGSTTTANPTAIVRTNFGTFTILLYKDKAPLTAGNFISLAKSGFFDGVTFHRVAANFVIQGGDPEGTGSGGSGQTIAWENTGLKNVKYSVAMARSGDPNTASGAGTATSQFFINLKNNPSLDSYTYPFVVFGQVVSGTDVVDTIGALYTAGQTSYDGPPTQQVVMESVTIQGA